MNGPDAPPVTYPCCIHCHCGPEVTHREPCGGFDDCPGKQPEAGATSEP